MEPSSLTRTTENVVNSRDFTGPNDLELFDNDQSAHDSRNEGVSEGKITYVE
jgi:hypothetical protein